MKGLLKIKWVQYALKLLAIYGVLYFGTLGVIGVSAPGGYYSSFVGKYLNYPALIREALLYAADGMLKICGYPSEIDGAFKIRLHGGHGINVIYGCLGAGVTSFWVAFVAANDALLKKKLLYIIAGSLAIFFINAARLALLVVVANNNRQGDFIESHHTFFNIAAYGCIIFMMYLFGRNPKEVSAAEKATTV